MKTFVDPSRFSFRPYGLRHPMGNPRQANIFRTRGYFADMLLKPMKKPLRNIRYWGKTLDYCFALERKGRCVSGIIRNPTMEDIRKALRIIERGELWSHVILSRTGGNYYMQTDVFALEYRNDTEDEHYFCPPEYLTSELILDAFLSYAEESSWWQEQVVWKKGYGI